MPAATLNLTDDMRIEQGATWWLSAHWTDANGSVRDLSTGWNARMQFRKTARAPVALTGVTSEDGEITLTDGSELTLGTWDSETAYVVGDYVKPTVSNGYKYRCTEAGTSGTVEPTWTTDEGDTFDDGSVTWMVYGLSRNPNIQICLPAAKSDLLSQEQVYYDLELVEDATEYVFRVIQGYATVSLNVTR